jgi:response regulator RpfG family c-di-GMP phosphodiesterase
VETEAQMNHLRRRHCDEMQGYLFSRPLPRDEFERLLASDPRLPLVTAEARHRTLLLVDDEAGIVAAIQRMLRREGYRIVTAHSAAEGLQRLTEVEVDVILSDQRMPGMTGVEFLRRAKEMYPETVRMVLSGFTELQSITDAINEGAIYKFLTKPWIDEQLRAHIAEAFRHKEMADENRRLTQELQRKNEELLAAQLERADSGQECR